jgi:hypothetical protein
VAIYKVTTTAQQNNRTIHFILLIHCLAHLLFDNCIYSPQHNSRRCQLVCSMFIRRHFALSVCFLVNVHALAHPKHTTRRRASDNIHGLSTEAIFAIVGVCVAILGIALTLAWPSRRRWLYRPRRISTVRSSSFLTI